jgi:hypothetical protein
MLQAYPAKSGTSFLFIDKGGDLGYNKSPKSRWYVEREIDMDVILAKMRK